MNDHPHGREAFEKWVNAVTGDDGPFAMLNGHYDVTEIESSWQGWNAAIDWMNSLANEGGEAVAYCVPQGHAMTDGSMENGPEYLVFSDEASEYEKRVGFPLFSRNSRP